MLRLSLRRSHQLRHPLQHTKNRLARWGGAEVVGLAAQSTPTCRMPSSSCLYSRSGSEITACHDRSNSCSALVTAAARRRYHHDHHHNYRENNNNNNDNNQGNSGRAYNSNNNNGTRQNNENSSSSSFRNYQQQTRRQDEGNGSNTINTNYNRHHRHHQNYNNNNNSIGLGNSDSSSGGVKGSNQQEQQHQQQQFTRRQRGDDGHGGGGNNHNYHHHQQQQQQQHRYDQQRGGGGHDSIGQNVSSRQQRYSNKNYQNHYQLDQSQQQQVSRSPQTNSNSQIAFSSSSSSSSGKDGGNVHAAAAAAKSTDGSRGSGSLHATRARGGPSAAMQGTTSAPFLSKHIKDRAPIGGALEIQQSRLIDEENKNDIARHKGIAVRGRIPAEHHCVAVLVDTETVTAEEFIANILPILELQCGPLTAEFAGNTRRSLRLAFPTPPANIPFEITSPLTSYLSMDEEAEAIRASPSLTSSSSSASLLSPSGTYYYNSLLRQAGGSAYFPSIFGNTADDDLSSLRSSAAFLHGTSSSSANEGEKGTANGLTPTEDAARRPIPATVPAKHIAGVYESYHSARPIDPTISGADHRSSHQSPSPSLGYGSSNRAVPPSATVCLVRCYGHGIISPQWRKVLTLLGNSVRERDQNTTKVSSSTTADGTINTEKRVPSVDSGEHLRFSLQISTGDLPAPPIYSKNRKSGLATHASDTDEGMEKAESTPEAPKPSSLAALTSQLFGKETRQDPKQGNSSGEVVNAATRQLHPVTNTIHLSNKAAVEYFQVDEFLPTAVQMTAEIGHLLHHSPTNMLTGIVTCVGQQDRAGFLFEAMRHQRHFVSQYVLTGNKGGRLEGTSFGPVFIEDE